MAKLLTLVIYLGQFFTSKFEMYFQFKEQNYQNNCSPPNFYLPTREEIAPPHTSPNLTENILSD